MNNSSQWLNKSAGARIEQLRRLRGWQSRRADESLNAYSASQEVYTSGVVAGRIAAVDAGCCVGDFYMVGRFNTSGFAIYNSNGEESDIELTRVSNNTTLYLIKYNRNGEALWGAKMGAPPSDALHGLITIPIVYNVGSAVYVCGYLYNPTLELYNSGSTTPNLTLSVANGNYDCLWLAKYTSDGIVEWVTYVDCNNIMGRPYVTTDRSGSNVYLTGRFRSTVRIYQVGSTTSAVTSLISTGDFDNFLVKYNSAGAYQWSAKIGGNASEGIPDIICDYDDNVYISSYYASNPLKVYNAGGSFAFDISNNGLLDSYLVKYNASGSALWGTHIGGVASDTFISITVDLNNNVYISSGFTSPSITIYNPGNVTAFTLTNTDQTQLYDDVYIVKYSPTGVAQWATRIGGITSEVIPYIITDKFNNLLISGVSTSSQLSVYNSGNQVTPALTLTPLDVSSSNPIVFLAKYNTNGVASWVTRVENSNTSGTYRPIITSDGANTYLNYVYNTGTLNIYDKGATVTPARTLINSSGTNTFIVKYDSAGNSQWAAQNFAAINPNIHTTF